MEVSHFFNLHLQVWLIGICFQIYSFIIFLLYILLYIIHYNPFQNFLLAVINLWEREKYSRPLHIQIYIFTVLIVFFFLQGAW